MIKNIKHIALNLRTMVMLSVFTFSYVTLSAQTSVNATGGNASGDGGSAGWSVGQVVYTTNTGTSGSVTQGVQQPYEISVITGIEETGISLSMIAYPNPTTDHLTLSIDNSLETNHDLSQLIYQLYDINGKLLQSEKISGSETQIDMSIHATAIYFLKVMAKTQGLASQEVKTFKIVKN